MFKIKVLYCAAGCIGSKNGTLGSLSMFSSICKGITMFEINSMDTPGAQVLKSMYLSVELVLSRGISPAGWFWFKTDPGGLQKTNGYHLQILDIAINAHCLSMLKGTNTHQNGKMGPKN